MDKPLLKLLLFFQVLFLLVCQSVAEPLRLNSIERSVVIPTSQDDYSLVQVGFKLFVAWTERTGGSKQREVVLVEADLERLEVKELLREKPGEGIPLSPQLVTSGNHLQVAWLVRKGSGSRAHYEISFLSIDRSNREISQKQSFPYGFQRRGFQLLANPHGVFLLGASTPGRREPMGLRLFRKGSEAWELLTTGPSVEGCYDEQPSLGSGKDYLHLAWVRDGRVHVTRSADGLDWSSPQALSGDGASYPMFLQSGGEEVGIAWVTKTGQADSQIHLATSSDDGTTWWHGSQSLGLPGVRCELHAGFIEDGTHLLLYDYWNSEEKCERIESCIMKSGWKCEWLNRFPEAVCGRSLSPAVLKRDNELYLVWQERRGRQTSISVNYTASPWQKWLPVPQRVLESEGEMAYATPRLISWQGRKFLICFVYHASPGPMQKSMQVGDLVLLEYVLEGAGS